MQNLIDELIKASSQELYLEGEKVIPQFSSLREKRENVAAVDGGSAVLLQTPAVCVLFARIIAVRVDPKEILKEEAFIIAQAQGTCVRVSVEGEELFSAQASDIGETPLLDAVNLGRKILEWRMVEKTPEPVVWDGAFTASTIEKKFLPKKGMALAKSSGMMGNLGVFDTAPSAPWVAQAGKHQFVQLFEKGEIYRASGDEAQLGVLASWAKDPVYPGYPYPLILADQLARVSNQERATRIAQLQSLAGKHWEQISKGNQEAHAILDSLQY